jgi:ABC-2 type transport system ATP-binding protein
MPALSAQGLSKRYGTTEALSEISLQVTEGELIGLLGPNGAGKSTFAKIICGLVRPSRGSVEVFGERPGSRDASAAIGYLAELFRFPEWLSALEVLKLHQRLADSSGGQSERQDLLASVGLAEEGDRRVATMSKGMQQRLGLAQALIGSPRLLLLDEPTSALDPAGRRTVRDLLARLRSGGTSILLSSHLLSEVELICDRVAILYRGKLVTEGVPAELTRGAGVEVETTSGIRRFDDTAREQIPELVGRLVAEGERIFAVREVSSTLEDFYIETVGGDDPE